jgi:hypothetical protein
MAKKKITVPQLMKKQDGQRFERKIEYFDENGKNKFNVSN